MNYDEFNIAKSPFLVAVYVCFIFESSLKFLNTFLCWRQLTRIDTKLFGKSSENFSNKAPVGALKIADVGKLPHSL